MQYSLKKIKKNVKAATAIEYGLIAAGVAIAIAGAVFLMGDNLNDLYEAISNMF